MSEIDRGEGVAQACRGGVEPSTYPADTEEERTLHRRSDRHLVVA